MFRSRLFFLICIFIFSGIGCSEDFLETENVNGYTRENYFRNKEEAFESVVSCYEIMKSVGMFGLNFQWFTYSVDGLSVFENTTWNELQFKKDNGHINSIFVMLYRGVYRCNVTLELIPGADIPNKETSDRFIAETHFFRGFYYFYLGVLFGTPPLIKTEMSDRQKGLGNSEKGEVLDFAIEELKKASPALPLKNNIDKTMLGRISRGAAHAMIGKCYLWKAQYDSAAHYFGKVIASGQYELVRPQKEDSLDYVSAYLSNFTSEPINTYGGENNIASILEVQNAHYPEDSWCVSLPGYGSDGSHLSKYFSFVQKGSWNNFAPNEKASELFEKGGPEGMVYDPRRAATLICPGDTIEFRTDMIEKYWDGEIPIFDGFPKSFGDDYGCRKYYYPVHYGETQYHDPNNWRVIRYAHVLLMYAEAQYHLGNTAEALDKINMVRARVGMPARTAVSPKTIIHETRVECMFEVCTVLHIIRWGAMDRDLWGQNKLEAPWIKTMTDYIPNFNINKHELFPFPEDEVEFQEGALKQNPGWF